MSLIKRIGFLVFVTLAVMAGIWAYFSIKNSKRPNMEALRLLPDSCSVYFNTASFSELNKRITSQSLVFDKLKAIPEINKLCYTLNLFDSLVQSNTVLQKELDGALIHLAVYGSSNNWLTAFNIKELGKQQEVFSEVVKLLKAKETKANIYQFNFSAASAYYFHIDEGVVLVSDSRGLIEKSIQSGSSKFSVSKNYIAVKSTLTENNLISIYINHQLLSKSKLGGLLNMYSTNNRAFTAGAIGLEPSEIKSTGIFKVDSSDVLSAFVNQTSQSSDELADILPASIKTFKAYGFSDFAKINTQFAANGELTNFWLRANEKALYNLKTEFYTNLKNHLIDLTCTNNSRFLAVQINDSIKALDHLRVLSDSVFDTNSGYVFTLLKQPASQISLFKPFYDGRTSYMALYKSYLLFSDSLPLLTGYIQDLTDKLTAFNDPGFAAYKTQNFPDTYNYLFYTSPALTSEGFAGLVDVNRGERMMESFKHFSYCLINDQEDFKFRCELQNEADNKGKDQNNLWAFKMDSISTFKPCAFVNHQTNDNEIVVQDNSNALYLINNKGKLLWKKPLNEKINSEIIYVDAFKNKKYQLLFSSKNYIHLIDRNGEYVSGYPVKLEAEITMPLCVFDYESTLEYRLFVACKNNMVYCYTIQGRQNEGFTKVHLEKEMRLPIQYAKVGASDYLVGIDVEGKIYTFSRRGEPRIGLRNRAIINCSSFMVDATTNVNSTSIIYVDDKSGAINKISISDKKEIVNLNYESEATKVKYALVDENREVDLVTTHNQSFLVYNLMGDLLLQKHIGQELGQAEFYGDESHAMYFAPVKEKNLVIVYQALRQKTNTIEATSMPLVSNLFGNDKKYLIVCNGHWLYCKAVN